jgi:hypothetical protein
VRSEVKIKTCLSRYIRLRATIEQKEWRHCIEDWHWGCAKNPEGIVDTTMMNLFTSKFFISSQIENAVK